MSPPVTICLIDGGNNWVGSPEESRSETMLGYSRTLVEPCLRAAAMKFATVNPPDGLITTVPWRVRAGKSSASNPPAWKAGPAVCATEVLSIFHFCACTAAIHIRLAWVHTAPFGV